MAWTVAQTNRQINLLVQGGLTPVGASGLVARWAVIENPGGNPGIYGGYKGRAFGNAQWLGSRRDNLFAWADANDLNPADADVQTLFALHELNTTEKRAGDILRSAQTPFDAALGASVFERAEGYNAASGIDNFTNRTADAVPGFFGEYEKAANNTAALQELQEAGLFQYGNEGDESELLDNLPNDVATKIAEGDVAGAGKDIAKAGDKDAPKVGRASEGFSIAQAINKLAEQLQKSTIAAVQTSAQSTQSSVQAASGITTGIQSLASNLFVRGALIGIGIIFILAGVLGLAFGSDKVKAVATAAVTKKVPVKI